MPGIDTLAPPPPMAPPAAPPGGGQVPPQIAQSLQQTFGQMPPEQESQFADLSQQLDQFRPEELQALLDILSYLQQNKARYAEAVQELVAQGKIQQDDVPSQYEPVFFSTMISAIQKRMQGGQQGAPMPEPAPFAQGGLASLAQTMSAAGRNGDNMLAHITPTEARYLNRVSGRPTINPVTGLPEYSLLGSVGDFLKKASTVILPIALGATPLGPIAGAAFGSGIASLINGGKAADALKAGLIGGATGAVMSGISGMLSSDSAFKSFLPDVGNASGKGFFEGVQAGLPSQLQMSGDYAMNRGFPQWMGGSGSSPMSTPSSVDANAIAEAQGQQNLYGSLPGSSTPADSGGGTPEVNPNAGGAPQANAQPGVPQVQSAAQASSSPITTAKNFFFPGGADNSVSGITGSPDYKAAITAGMSPGQAYQIAAAKAEPSFLAKYGPTAALGIGALALAGGFKTPKTQTPGVPAFSGPSAQEMVDANPVKYGVGELSPYQYVPKQDNFVAQSQVVAPASYTQPVNTQAGLPRATPVPSLLEYYYGKRPVAAATGGVMNAAAYKRAHGHLRGPGTGTSDSIPAKLSDGEFVMTAKAVRGAGDGDRMAGAKKMYQMMRELEKRG